MKILPKALFLVLIGLSALAGTASADYSINTHSVTIQTPLVPVELYIASIVITIGLIVFAITRKDHSAIWVSVLSVLSAAFCLGCSFAYGSFTSTVEFVQEANLVGANVFETLTAVTNIGCTLFSAGLLIFSIIMLVASIFAVWQEESKAVI